MHACVAENTTRSVRPPFQIDERVIRSVFFLFEHVNRGDRLFEGGEDARVAVRLATQRYVALLSGVRR